MNAQPASKEINITTIAVNKEEIACDQQATHGSGYKLKVSTKIHRFDNTAIYPKPFYIGFAGGLEQAHGVLEWFNNPTDKPPKTRDNEFVVLTSDKKIFTFVNPTKWLEIKEPFYSVGSGSKFALGALHAGKSPKESVAIACKCDPDTGMGVKSFTFK